MRRRIDRSKKLPAFALDLPALRLLIAELTEVFSDCVPTLFIEISLKGEELEFRGLDELEAYAARLPSTVTSLSWRMSDYDSGRMCRLRRRDASIEVGTSASGEAWCAGAIALVETHATRNKLWYSFLTRWVVWLCPIILAFAPLLSYFLLHRVMSIRANIQLFVLQLLLWTIYLSYNRLLPRHVLVMKKIGCDVIQLS